jgi:hypothetical protein
MQAVPSGERANAPSGVWERASWVLALIVAAIASLAITSLIHSKPAAAQSASAQVAPPSTTVPPHASREAGSFAFGYVEFDWDPAKGVPGFSSWPSGQPSR